MSNPYFDFPLSAYRFVARTKVRAEDVNARLDDVSYGFEGVNVKLVATVKAPDGEVLANLPAKVDRANKAMVFDANGDPIATISATSAEMAAAVAAAATASAAAATATAAAASVTAALNATCAAVPVIVAGTTQTMAAGTPYVFTNTLAQSTATLPAAPNNNDTVLIVNCTGRQDLLVNCNGKLLIGLAENMTIDRTNVAITLRYFTALGDWRTI